MKKQNILLSSLTSALLIGTIFSAKAQDVYVDLSVLDNLDNNSSFSQPMFPVVSPQKERVVKKAPKKAKKVSKKVSKPEDKVVIPAKKDIKISEVVSAPKDDSQDLSSEKAQVQNQPINKEAAEKLRENIETTKKNISETNSQVAQEPLKKTDEPAPQNEVKDDFVTKTPSENLSSVEQTKENSQVQTSEITPTTDGKNQGGAPVKEVEKETQVTPISLPAKDSVQAQKVLKNENEGQDNRIESILVPQKTMKNVGKNLVFADGVSKLSEDKKQQLDTIISGFEDAQHNKIAILAYNYDDGEEVFKKKRTCLNRAIEVRSYLLGKGYKNFSIKVVNVTEESKNNLVTVEELK